MPDAVFKQGWEGFADMVCQVKRCDLASGGVVVEDLVVRVEGDDRIVQLAEEGGTPERDDIQHTVAEKAVRQHNDRHQQGDEGEVDGGVINPCREGEDDGSHNDDRREQ